MPRVSISLAVITALAVAGCIVPDTLPPDLEDEEEGEPTLVDGLWPLTLTPDAMTVWKGDTLRIHRGVKPDDGPRVHYTKHQDHSLNKCWAGEIPDESYPSCAEAAANGFVMIPDSIVDQIALSFECNPRSGTGAVNLTSCFSLRVWTRLTGPGLAYPGGGWVVDTCGSTWFGLGWRGFR